MYMPKRYDFHLGTGVPTSPEQGVTEPQFKYQENRGV